jgi:hypothetical protein
MNMKGLAAEIVLVSERTTTTIHCKNVNLTVIMITAILMLMPPHIIGKSLSSTPLAVVVTASAGTSIKIAFIAFWGNISAAAAGTTYKGQNFRNVPGILTPRLISFGSKNRVFG